MNMIDHIRQQEGITSDTPDVTALLERVAFLTKTLNQLGIENIGLQHKLERSSSTIVQLKERVTSLEEIQKECEEENDKLRLDYTALRKLSWQTLEEQRIKYENTIKRLAK